MSEIEWKICRHSKGLMSVHVENVCFLMGNNIFCVARFVH